MVRSRQSDWLRVRLGALTALDLAALIALWPDWATLAHGLAAPAAWVGAVGADQAVERLAGAGLWCTALWLALAFLVLLASNGPAFLAPLAHRVMGYLVPRSVVRVIAGAAGLSVLLTPVAAGAKTVSPTSRPAATTSAAAAELTAPAWPTDGIATSTTATSTTATATTATSTTATSAAPSGALTSSISPKSGQSPGSSETPTSESTPAPVSANWPTGPPTIASSTPGDQRQTSNPARGTGERVTVRPGDSLWLIAAHRLGRDAGNQQIAVQWPHWYAANRSVIGPDPGLLQVGEVLIAPTTDPHSQGETP